MRRVARGLALCALLCVAACSRTESPSATLVDVQGQASTESVRANELLFDRIQLAPLRVRHGGTRRLEFHYDTAGVAHSLVYTERVTADGRGQFALDPVNVTMPAMTTVQLEAFELLQKRREGFFFRYRDFGVRQRDLFLANYRVAERTTHAVVAGRGCTEFEVRRIDRSLNTYIIDVDIDTGLVLRCTEFSADRRVAARFEFTEFTLDPVLDGVEWFTPKDPSNTVELSSEALASLDFTPASPRLLPKGYQLLRSEIVPEGGKVWVRRVYGDGVECLFVLHSGSRAALEPGLDSRSAGPGTTPVEQSALAAAKILNVRLCQAGTWTLAEAVRGGEQIFVIGKLPEEDVARLLQSAF